MDKVKIELSEKQYKTLLKLVYLGEWVSQSYNEEPSAIIEEVEQTVYSVSKGTKAENWIELDDKTKRYFPTVDMEEEMLESIDEYDDYVFWDELVDRLAERDLIKEHGEDKISKMSFEDRLEIEDPIIEQYEEEFSKSGITKLNLDQE